MNSDEESHRIPERIFYYLEKLADSIFAKFFNLLHKEYGETLRNEVLQFTKFGIVGATTTLISYFTYVIFILTLDSIINYKYNYLVASFIAFFVSVTWSYYWNNRLVFIVLDGEKRNIIITLLKTYASYAFTGLVVSNLLLYIWIEKCHISELIAPIISLLITVPLNYVISKFWTFR